MARRYLLLQNGTVIDGTGRDPMERASVLVDRERIVSVGAVDTVASPSADDTTVVDVTGKIIMPGMVDCHFHGIYNEVRALEDQDLRKPIEQSVIDYARNSQTLLEVGFTAAREVGCRGLVSFVIRDMIEKGVLVGPRLKTCGRILTCTGGLADFYGNWVDNCQGLGVVVDGEVEVVRQVREQIKYGADVIKVESSGVGVSTYAGSQKQTMTQAEIGAAVHEAHRNGVRVACHAQGAESIKTAVRAGVDTIEHGIFLDEEGAELMKQAGTLLTPTLAVVWLFVHKGAEVGIPAATVESFRGDLVSHVASFQMAADRGIPMAVGSDAGHAFFRQSEVAFELEMMVMHGYTPLQAIQAATSTGARAIGFSETGEVREGKLADLLVIAGDPLADIGILRDRQALERVYKGGQLMAGSLAPRRIELELGYGLAPTAS